MVDLSYSGITQLYTATTNPPHLAAITPQSVIADPWMQEWPGRLSNSCLTQPRAPQTPPGGTNWVTHRIPAGDATCAANMPLRNQNPGFENLAHSLTTY